LLVQAGVRSSWGFPTPSHRSAIFGGMNLLR